MDRQGAERGKERGSHTGVLEGSSIPPENDVDDKVEDGQEYEAAASHDQDEGERPEVLVERDHSLILLALTQHHAQSSLQQTHSHSPSTSRRRRGQAHQENAPEEEPNENVVALLVGDEDAASLNSEEADDDGVERAQSTLRIIGSEQVVGLLQRAT